MSNRNPYVYMLFFSILYLVSFTHHANAQFYSYDLIKKYSEMRFNIVKSGKNKKENWIEAFGLITTNTYAEFKYFLDKNPHDNLTIYFNSTGGDALGGMQLGRLIRAAGLNTSIGKKGLFVENLTEAFLFIPHSLQNPKILGSDDLESIGYSVSK